MSKKATKAQVLARKARRAAYMKQYHARNKERRIAAKLKHAMKDDEALMADVIGVLPLDAERDRCPNHDPATAMMDREVQEIPEVIKRIESQSKTIIVMLNRNNELLEALYKYFQVRSATPATHFVDTAQKVPEV